MKWTGMNCVHDVPFCDFMHYGRSCACCSNPAELEGDSGSFYCLPCFKTQRPALQAECNTLREQLGFTHAQVAQVARLLDPEACPDAWGLHAAAQKVLAERDALAAAEALEARYRAGIRAALRALHAVHASLPDGDVLPRQSADALALAVEGALLAALGGEA